MTDLKDRIDRLIANAEARAAPRGAARAYDLTIDGLGAWRLRLGSGAPCRVRMTARAAARIVDQPGEALKLLIGGAVETDDVFLAALALSHVFPGALHDAAPALARAVAPPEGPRDRSGADAFFAALPALSNAPDGALEWTVEGAGVWAVDADGARTGPAPDAACRIALSRPAMDRVLADDAALWPLLRGGDMQVSDHGDAMAWLQALFPQALAQGMTAAERNAMFDIMGDDPTRFEFVRAVSHHHTYMRSRDGDLVRVAYARSACGRAFVQGDITIGKADAAEAVRAHVEDGAPLLGGSIVKPLIGDHAYRWPDGIVPYEMEDGGDPPGKVENAMAEIEEATNVSFVKRTDEEDYVLIVDAESCYSDVGRQGGCQEIGLDWDCLKGNVMHELLHTLGMFHEHQRMDRDNYITIDYGNIDTEGRKDVNEYLRQNYDKRTSNESYDYGHYDYGSILHYSRRGNAKDGCKDVITPKKEDAEIGQRRELSAWDISAINEMYPAQE